ncbi:peptidylprolyl isomerase [Gilvimarinus sp. F26214L]|uniref:peptidylprolyl isomerase n=1 Tax=Gilvimarinus sp. DZF01 TaxID=3461371 RepID=UPI0040456946
MTARSDLIYSDSRGDLSAAERIEGTIEVNGETIGSEDVLREMQYHPARSLEEARFNAARALTIRALLLQEAGRLKIAPQIQPDETEDEARIRQLLEREVATPEPDQHQCRRFYEKNRAEIRKPGEYLVSHILLAAAPDDAPGRDRAEASARDIIEKLDQDRARFAEFAARFSACPSREQGGSLGWIRRGQTVPEFEKAVERMSPATLRRTPVSTRYGCHVVYLEARRDGKPLEFHEAEPLIRDYLRESVYRRAASQYVELLVARADINGINLETTDSSLMR